MKQKIIPTLLEKGIRWNRISKLLEVPLTEVCRIAKERGLKPHPAGRSSPAQSIHSLMTTRDLVRVLSEAGFSTNKIAYKIQRNPSVVRYHLAELNRSGLNRSGLKLVDFVDPIDPSKPIETKPIETKPIETKPIETKPIETKPIESKPIESKPIDSSKSVWARTVLGLTLPPVPSEATEPRLPDKLGEEDKQKIIEMIKKAESGEALHPRGTILKNLFQARMEMNHPDPTRLHLSVPYVVGYVVVCPIGKDHVMVRRGTYCLIITAHQTAKVL